jgi:hypothetical protein
MQASSKIHILGAVLRRPHLWVTALRQLLRLVPSGWYTRSPFLPVPPADYMEFRLVTQYGGEHGVAQATASDVVAYLKWCKQWNDGRA